MVVLMCPLSSALTAFFSRSSGLDIGWGSGPMGRSSFGSFRQKWIPSEIRDVKMLVGQHCDGFRRVAHHVVRVFLSMMVQCQLGMEQVRMSVRLLPSDKRISCAFPKL